MALLIVLFIINQSPDRPSVRFCAVGDIMLDRGIRRVIERNNIDYPFEKIADFISTYDLAFCNLECPVSAIGYSTGKVYCFRADTNFFTGLTEVGFNLFCLANNHVIDWGAAACLDTRAFIEKANLHAVGAGEDQLAAIKPTIITSNGLKFACIASVGAPLRGLIWPLLKPGPAQVSLDTITAAIRAVRDSVDFVIASMHWGTEYVHIPDQGQIDWAHKMIDAGADFVIGHHPHVLQSVEIYKNKVIVYSLGNFIFDQRKLYQRQSMILSAVFKKGLIDSISLHPVLIENFQPALARDTMFNDIVGLIERISPGVLQHDIIDGRLIILNENRNPLFSVPILRSSTDQNNVLVFNDRILIAGADGRSLDSCMVMQGEILDAEILAGAEPKIIAIIRSPLADYADNVAYYQIKKDSIHEISIIHTDDRPWKIEKGDLDGDSDPELCIAVHKKAKFSKDRTNRIQVFCIEDHRLDPLWFSSLREIEFTDMILRDLQNDGLTDLLALRENNSGKELLVYQWIGSRFVLDHILISGIECDNIEDALFQYSKKRISD